MPSRRLPQIFNSGTLNAVSNRAPNTLNSNKPSVNDAMGISGRSGVLSFGHDYTSSDPDFTIWLWSDIRNAANPAKGWWKASEAAIGSTKTVPAEALCTVTLPENTPYYIQASVTGVRNLWTSGSKHPSNPYPDKGRADANS